VVRHKSLSVCCSTIKWSHVACRLLPYCETKAKATKKGSVGDCSLLTTIKTFLCCLARTSLLHRELPMSVTVHFCKEIGCGMHICISEDVVDAMTVHGRMGMLLSIFYKGQEHTWLLRGLRRSTGLDIVALELVMIRSCGVKWLLWPWLRRRDFEPARQWMCMIGVLQSACCLALCISKFLGFYRSAFHTICSPYLHVTFLFSAAQLFRTPCVQSQQEQTCTSIGCPDEQLPTSHSKGLCS
jgi:hypothetical protein